MKHIRFLCILIIIFLSACSDDSNSHTGTIIFTAAIDCDIRLFDSNGRQTGREHYEVGKSPAVIQMKSTGIFVIYATGGNLTVKETITYSGGNLEYYINF